MKNAMKIYLLGQDLMVLGSVLYVVELLTLEHKALTLAITLIYAISLVLILIGWIATKDERAAQKGRQGRQGRQPHAAAQE